MFKPCTEERWDYALGVLPPIWGRNGFLLGEPSNHQTCKVSGQIAPTFAAFKRIGEKYYESTAPMTFKEFQAYDDSTLPK